MIVGQVFNREPALSSNENRPEERASRPEAEVRSSTFPRLPDGTAVPKKSICSRIFSLCWPTTAGTKLGTDEHRDKGGDSNRLFKIPMFTKRRVKSNSVNESMNVPPSEAPKIPDLQQSEDVTDWGAATVTALEGVEYELEGGLTQQSFVSEPRNTIVASFKENRAEHAVQDQLDDWTRWADVTIKDMASGGHKPDGGATQRRRVPAGDLGRISPLSELMYRLRAQAKKPKAETN